MANRAINGRGGRGRGSSIGRGQLAIRTSDSTGSSKSPAQRAAIVPGVGGRDDLVMVQLTPEQANQLRFRQFVEGLNIVLGSETEAALEAIDTGIYIGWRVPGNDYDCQRVGSQSTCFCGHSLQDHCQYTAKSVNVRCAQKGCSCAAFRFIPNSPEQVGQHWLRKRPNGEQLVAEWRAKCRCKHAHNQHCAKFMRCKASGCSCSAFNSDFLCAACDKHWEEHETIFEDESERKANNLPVGTGYIPLAELPKLQQFLAKIPSAMRAQNALAAAPGPKSLPPPASKGASNFRPVYD